MYIILVDNDDEANIKSIIIFLVTYCKMHEEYVNVLLNNKKTKSWRIKSMQLLVNIVIYIQFQLQQP